mmetsp:Transcript_18064/g.30813  ORF Transcript_18064/g.30813 Transcript_18064/m.30813 type:complete len:124 (-) Transcript_18064:1306-1677(-)
MMGMMPQMGYHQPPWMNPQAMMRPSPFAAQVTATQEVKEEAKQEEVKQEEAKNPVGEVSKNMVEVLQNSSDPKHRNSEFLKFLKQLNSGAYEIENETELKVNQAKMEEFQKQEDERMIQEIKR